MRETIAHQREARNEGTRVRSCHKKTRESCERRCESLFEDWCVEGTRSVLYRWIPRHLTEWSSFEPATDDRNCTAMNQMGQQTTVRKRVTARRCSCMSPKLGAKILTGWPPCQSRKGNIWVIQYYASHPTKPKYERTRFCCQGQLMSLVGFPRNLKIRSIV